MKETRSTCPYCGVGCGVIIHSEGAQITGVKGDPQHPANFGRLCSKGSTLQLSATAEVTLQTRLLQPLQRLVRGSTPQPVTWDSALHTATTKFAQIIRDYGPDAVGFYVSGQLLTEDYYVFNKLAKGLIGTNNIDTNSRLCMSSAVAGYKKTLGADAPPNCYDDVQFAQTLFIAGSNTAFAHPVLFRRIEDARRANPTQKMVVVDVRRTDTAEVADLFLQIQPGTDVMLFHGMLHLMLWEGWVDPAYMRAHTSGFDALKATVRDYTPDAVAATCGIRKEDLVLASRWFAGVDDSDVAHSRTPTLSLYCQGLNQSSAGTAKNAALINLHLACGQIGKPGAGPFSLTGQPNAMGGREVGGLANLLSAHRDLANPAHRAEVAALWGVSQVPDKPGKTAVEMFQAAADGEIKALWIACTNPAQSMPDQATVRRALERAEFVVLQEAFATTATCAYADLLLPATTWGEKDGTVTNSERRISRVRPAVAAPGDAHHGPRHDWAIAVDFAQRLEKLLVASTVPIEGLNQAQPTRSLFPYPTPESVWNEHRESTRGRDLDITGMSYQQLEERPLQWPMREGQSAGAQRLYEDGVFPTADGRAHFANVVYKPVAEARDARFPFSLTTGRLRDQWHGMSRTGTVGRLFGHVSEPAVLMHPQDMARRLLKEGDLVHLSSKRGAVVLPVQASKALAMSQLFMAMHWGEEFVSGLGAKGQRLSGVNALTTSAFCPDSKQPEFKHAAVKVVKAELPWSLVAMAWLPDAYALTARRALQSLMAEFAYASCVPFANAVALDSTAARQGVLFKASHAEAIGPEALQRIAAVLQLDGADVVRYDDPKRGQQRRLRRRMEGTDTRLEGFLLAGDTRAQRWIAPLLQGELPVQSYGRALLSPGATPPIPVASAGTVVCTCFNVTDQQIHSTLSLCEGSPTQRLQSLQTALQCGTNCGSCLPQLQGLVRRSADMRSETP
ncbi:nitrate reductase [Rhodoferax aquaticus]|uniref:Nitrate reductase n=1 Tax=Rhodoferax aquaticus TaxID=2527691 RepID=A0A515ET63_9BURK|nr:nitrate reductase [Rhodoferax aquaticus]QDL55860.1 nitrate reductase [Rhodoferax aquaticus]